MVPSLSKKIFEERFFESFRKKGIKTLLNLEIFPDCYIVLTFFCNSPEMSKQCNSPGIFTGLVVFLDVFFRKFGEKKRKMQQSGSEYCRLFYNRLFRN